MVTAHHSVLPGCGDAPVPHAQPTCTSCWLSPPVVSLMFLCLSIFAAPTIMSSAASRNPYQSSLVLLFKFLRNFLSLCSFLCHPRCGLSLLCVRLIRHLWLAPSSSFPVSIPEQRKPSMCPDSAPSLWDVLRNEPQKEAVKWNGVTGLRP